MSKPKTFHIMDDLNDDIQSSIDQAKEMLSTLNNLDADFAVPPEWTADMGEQMIKLYKDLNKFIQAANKITYAHDEYIKQTKLV